MDGGLASLSGLEAPLSGSQRRTAAAVGSGPVDAPVDWRLGLTDADGLMLLDSPVLGP